MCGTQIVCDAQFVLAAGRRNDVGPFGPDHLHEQLTHASGSGVDERDLIALHRPGGVDQVMSRHPLQHRRRGDIETQTVGHGHHDRRLHVHQFGCAAAGLAPGNSVADGEICHAVTDSHDLAGSLLAQDERGVTGVDALPLVDVDEVDSDGGHLHLDLVRPGRYDIDVLHCEDGSVAVFGHHECARHVFTL